MANNSDGIFYGWYVIAVSAIGMCFAHAGVVNFGFSSFILPLSEEFEFSRAAIAFAFTAAMLAFTIATPLVGVLIDSHGVRRVLLGGTAVFGALVCSMYFLTASIWHLYGMYVLLGIFGSATSAISYSRLAISWFDKKKGLALALAITGAGVAGIIFPPLVASIVRLSGWREAFLFLGAVNLFVCLPALYWIIRDTPEEMGTYPDGIPPKTLGGAADVSIAIQGYTFRDSVRTLRFWQIGGIFALFAAAQTGPISQLVPLLADSGFTPTSAAYGASLLGVSLIVARLLCGFLMDKYFAPYVAAGFLIVPAFGLAWLGLQPGFWSGILATIGLGLAMGAEFDVMPFFCAQYFGRRAFGKIYGLILVLFALAAAPAVFLTGISYDVFSSYSVALIIGAALSLIAVGLLLLLGEYPELPTQSRTS